MSRVLPERRATLRLPCLLLLGCLLVACGRGDAPPAAARVGQLAQAPGQWLVVNYWAEWCKPCIEEIPELNAFAREHASTVRVLMVNYDGASGEELLAQARQLGIEAELLEEDPAGRLGFKRPEVLPSTYLIRPDGGVKGVLLGPQTVASLAAALEE